MWLIWWGEDGFVRMARLEVAVSFPAGSRYPSRFGGHCLFSLRQQEGGRIRVLQRRSPAGKSRVAGVLPFPPAMRCKARGRYPSFRCGA
ncbi:hypothetical protein [Oxalobacter paraformigenes]|uniref:Uncharacterized protein n=1 Tax=Oxalobacter paraformigenes TaxID=556268 RepID=T5LPS4_9BURK|nr:hypothetical protein [Oxalobacter paraformigenes]EQM95222.1 hypothetical protein OFAG_02218 [Oxalobacter paraformigenes]